MRNLKKQNCIHKHYHYHHYPNDDLSQDMAINSYKINSPSKISIEQNLDTMRQYQVNSQRLSWKDHINPEINNYYEKLDKNQVSQKYLQNQYFSSPYKSLKKLSISPSNSPGNNYLFYRAQLDKDIDNYREYLKTRSGPQQIIKRVKSMSKLQFSQIQNDSEVLKNQSNKKKLQPTGIQSLVFRNADSRYYSEQKKQDTMTQAATKISQNLQSNDFASQQLPQPNKQKLRLTSSQLKQNPMKQPLLLKKQQNSMIYLESRQNDKNSEQLNQESVFSLIKRQNNSIMQGPAQQNQVIKKHFNNLEQKNDNFDLYRYKLMKQQCKYLRERFIEHLNHQHSKPVAKLN